MSDTFSRSTDPFTAVDAGLQVDNRGWMRRILRFLRHQQEARNGKEMSVALDAETISVVPRLCKLRRQHAIIAAGTRPGPPPTYRSQLAYVITERGMAIDAGEIELISNPPAEPWERRSLLQALLLQVRDDEGFSNLSEELQQEILETFATFIHGTENEEEDEWS